MAPVDWIKPRWSKRRGSRTLGCDILAIAIVIAIVGLLLFPRYKPARGKGPARICQSNLKQLGLAMLLYAEDHDGQLPPASLWNGALMDYLTSHSWGDRERLARGLFVCPTTKKTYVFNSALGGRDINEIADHEKTPLLWDARSYEGHPPHGGGGETFTVVFLDGHCRWLTEDQLQLLWPRNGVKKHPEETDR